MKLKAYRGEHGLRQSDVAEILNVTRQTVSNLEVEGCIVIDKLIYKPVYDLEQLAESKSK